MLENGLVLQLISTLLIHFYPITAKIQLLHILLINLIIMFCLSLMSMVMRIHGLMVDSRKDILIRGRNVDFVFVVDRLWRKTRSKTSNPNCFGADPNRNWDYQWCEGKPSISSISSSNETSRWCYTRSM